jgi:shikimate dehydrogenase
MHAGAFAALGLPHTYEALRTTRDELPAIVRRLREGEFAGLNVTVPHKHAVLDFVDVADATAKAIGAANTLWARGGVVHATNTDAPAIAQELAALGLGAHPARALVLGSGGAARAATVALKGLGAEVTLRARDATAMAKELGARPEALRRGKDEAEFACIIQTTSAGMTGADPGDAIADAVDWSRVRDDAVVLEVIYSPRETPFLQAARARGLRATDGLSMLARQGALALEIWLGVPAPLEAMLAAITR